MGIVRWELSGMGTVHLVGIVRDGNCPGWELSGMGTVHLVGIVRDGNCPGWELSGYLTIKGSSSVTILTFSFVFIL